MSDLELFDHSALLPRLSSALKKRPREVIFLIGSPVSAPVATGAPGVPSVDGMISIIREEFSDDPTLQNQFDLLISTNKERRYQESFH